ncbi:MAG: hypothetical protein LBI99_09325, partial [Propionibacteriaceae bacterium]|nr:hypothetical protein [Propionibacteriaceae bacterium]
MINELGFYYQPELALAQASACRRRLATNASIFGFMAGLEVALLFIAPMFGWSDISSLLASLLPWYLIGLLISVLAALV